MPELDAELAELQRRAYGPGGNDLSPAERARLAQIEASQRGPDPQAGPPADVAIPPRPPAPGGAPADPGSGVRGSAAGRLGAGDTSEQEWIQGGAGTPRVPDSADPGAARWGSGGGAARWGTDGEAARSWSPAVRADGAAAAAREGTDPGRAFGDPGGTRGAGDRRGGRWFPPALIAAIAVGAVIVMLVAGGVGWGGGYAAGVARHAAPGSDAEFVMELHPTEMPDRLADVAGAYAFVQVDAETGELVAQGDYYGSLGDDIDVLVNRPFGGDDGYRDLPGDTVCLSVTQIMEQTETTSIFAGGTVCGSPRLPVSVDLFAGVEGGNYTNGMRIYTDAYPEDTLLRFTYSAASDSVMVWSLAPGA